ncbi:MAG: hypothetical protein LBS21_07520 [Clostridiales bacterium]|jgi:hypothetical protein|nr:hypothetical protein [Clostridiales bacterium]
MDYHVIYDDRKVNNHLNDEPVGEEFKEICNWDEANESPEGHTGVGMAIMRFNYFPYFVNLKATYESLGCAVITDVPNKTVFIYSRSFLERSPDWISQTVAVKQIINYNALNHGANKISAEFTNESLILKTETASETISAANADETHYMRYSDFKAAMERLK